MLRKSVFIAIYLMLLASPTLADDGVLDFLKPVWLTALEGMQTKESSEGGKAEAGEPAVISGAEQMEVVRYAVYMNQEYDAEAYVYAELKNTGEESICPLSVQFTVYDANNRKLAQEEYVTYAPEVVEPGESLYVTDWLYDFVSDITKVDHISVAMERSTYRHREIEKIDGADAYIDGEYLYAELTNTTEEPLFDAGVIVMAIGSDGRILDMNCEMTYSNTGIAPGSTILLRRRLRNQNVDAHAVTFEAYGYRYRD